VSASRVAWKDNYMASARKRVHNQTAPFWTSDNTVR